MIWSWQYADHYSLYLGEHRKVYLKLDGKNNIKTAIYKSQNDQRALTASVNNLTSNMVLNVVHSL